VKKFRPLEALGMTEEKELQYTALRVTILRKVDNQQEKALQLETPTTNQGSFKGEVK